METGCQKLTNSTYLKRHTQRVTLVEKLCELFKQVYFDPSQSSTFNISSRRLLVVDPEERVELSPRLHSHYVLVSEPHLIEEGPR